MLFSAQPDQGHPEYRARIVRLVMLAATTLLALGALVFPYSLRQASFPLKVGDVASQDIQAPYAFSYPSAVLTEDARKDAANSIQPIFLPSDPAIARRQIERLRIALNYITNVRADAFASQLQRQADLAVMTDVPIRPELGDKLLELSDSRWQTIQQETLNVLEQVMRMTIREGLVWEAQRNVPTFISYSIPPDQAALITELAVPFIVPNSILSPEQTDAARKEAIKAVQEVTRTYVAGEIIVRRGQIITAVL